MYLQPAKIQKDETKYTPVQKRVMAISKNYNAPIAAAYNIRPQRWYQNSHGQTYAARKEFIDTRSGKKISRGQACQIIDKYAYLQGEIIRSSKLAKKQQD